MPWFDTRRSSAPSATRSMSRRRSSPPIARTATASERRRTPVMRVRPVASIAIAVMSPQRPRSIPARRVTFSPPGPRPTATNRASAAISRTTSSPVGRPHACAVMARRPLWQRKRRQPTPYAPAATRRTRPETQPQHASGAMPMSTWPMEKRARASPATSRTRTIRAGSHRAAPAVMRRSPESTPVRMREASRAKGAISRTPSRRSKQRRCVFRAMRGRRPSWRRTPDTARAPRVTAPRSHTLQRKRRRVGLVTRRSKRAPPRATIVVRSATTRTPVSPRQRAQPVTRTRPPEFMRRSSAGARLAIVRMARRGSRRPRRARAVMRQRLCRLFMPSPATRSAAAVTWRLTNQLTPTASRAQARAMSTNARISRAPRYAPGATCSGVSEPIRRCRRCAEPCPST